MSQEAQTPSLRWRVPLHVWAAVTVFLCLQVMVVSHLRGPADPELYPLDATKHVPVNAYEDDGAINVAAALGLVPDTDRFSSLINIGGPFLLGGRAFVQLAGALGFVQCFDDPWLYAMYPDAYRKVWTAFGLYKALVFMPWFPLVLYWIGRNHLSERAGGLAAWMLAAMPFLTGFEARLKTDSPAMILGLFALLFLLRFREDGRRKNLFAASVLLGVSLSMKLLMVPVLAVLAAVVFARWREEGGTPGRPVRALVLSALVLVAAFFASNPLAVPGLAAYLKALTGSTVFLKADASAVSPGLLRTLAGRLGQFGVYFGSWLGALVLPALAFQLVRAARRRALLDPPGLLLLLFAASATYLYLVAPSALAVMTYYFLLPAVIAVLLMADALALCLGLLHRARPRLCGLAGLAVVGLLGAAFRDNLAVLACMTEPTNRQRAHAFLADEAKTGDTVGIPIEPDAETFSRAFGVDPFRFRLRKVGKDARFLTKERPDWLLLTRPDGVTPWPDPSGYLTAARFEAGMDLPQERFDLYQETPYAVYAAEKAEQERAEPDGDKADILFDLGQFVRADPEHSFNVLQCQALHLRPISLDLFRKSGQTLLPDATSAFAASVRDASSPLAYVHQVDRLTLAFWGVKYLLARDDDQAFAKETLASNRFDLEATAHLPGGVTVYRDRDYRGQAFFLAGAGERETRRKAPRPFLAWLRPLQPFGSIYSREDLARVDMKALAVTVRVKSDGPVDVILKGGASRRSLLAGPGTHELIVPYETGDGPEDVGYELHPARPGVRFTLEEITAEPLRVGEGGTVKGGSVSPAASFAPVAAERPGRVVFALPYVPGLWRATLDGLEVPTRPGPAGTVAVAVPAGSHFVALRPRS
jgi:hypothetical protein